MYFIIPARFHSESLSSPNPFFFFFYALDAFLKSGRKYERRKVKIKFPSEIRLASQKEIAN
jgi:hypothetical protein